jgi:oxygen-independent coproporphyrinogen-3 oxidase
MPAEPGVLQSPPLALYVHLPWCVRKCPYCDFNSHELRGEVPAAAYIAALLEDLEHDLPLVWGRTVSSVYFGGGTPSLFSAGDMDTLLSGIRARLDLAPAAEVTLEANPGTVERDSFAAYAESGINRVSLGAQTFDATALQTIGRIHDVQDIDNALRSLQTAGLDDYNVDLMFGLPGQSMDAAREDISRAVRSGATHLSHYQLTIEPNTAFAARPPALPKEDDSWSMQAAAADQLQRQGFRQYEISAWSQAGRECRHNLNYWRYGDFLGIGAGAHAKLSFPESGAIRRISKTRHPKHYLGGGKVATDREIDDRERIFEYFLNVLRLREGFTREHFSQRTGLAWKQVEEQLDEALAKGLLAEQGERLVHTETGWRFVNEIQLLFLP